MEYEISVSANLSKVYDFHSLKNILTEKEIGSITDHLADYLSKQNSDTDVERFEHFDSILPMNKSAINATTKKLKDYVVVGSWVEEACDELYILLKAVNATNIRISARDDNEGRKLVWTPPKLANGANNISIQQQVIYNAKQKIKKGDGSYLVQIYWDDDFERLRYTVEVSIKNGQFDGLQKVNMKSVNLFDIEYRGGVPHGQYKYIRKGKQLFESKYKKGKLHGDSYMKTEDDFVFANASFVDGFIDGSAQFLIEKPGRRF